ncbi:MAG: molecular chaperone TorD family protein [Betaproteobacteria bacterium]|nr:molecular chaperone TorD family protein [Betaproteobacteria bacterium]MDH5351147.1 molecular chaperone TorD family protein [Betaproteobacteria bacterium]
MSATMRFAPTASPEDQARAQLYGLIATLFRAPPDEQLLSALVHAEGFQGEDEERTELGRTLAEAWQQMASACRSAFPVLLAHEHTELFAAPGRAEVTPYLLHYVMRYESETPLVDLRAQLAQWGIARREGVFEPEDHIAALCETMRFAIAVQQRTLDEQKAFFDRFLYRGGIAFCDAVTASPKARFYKTVAAFARAFFEVEREAFTIGG